MGLFDKLHKTKDLNVYAPVSGNIVQLESLNDGVFSEHLLGEGLVIKPVNEIVHAPFDGKVVMTVESNHAIGLLSETGVEVLIHIGIDTVMMNGDGFILKVKQDDKVKKGDSLIEFSKEKIKEAGYKDDIVVIVSNSKDFSLVEITKEKELNAGDLAITIHK